MILALFLVLAALKEAGSGLWEEEEGPWKVLRGRISCVKFSDSVVET